MCALFEAWTLLMLISFNMEPLTWDRRHQGGFHYRMIYFFLFMFSSMTIKRSLNICCVRCSSVLCFGALTVLLDWQEGDMCSAHGMRPKTSVLTLWPPSLSQLSLQRQTLYIIFYFWLTHGWTDGGIAKDGGGWWSEQGKARASFGALSREDEWM